MESEEADQELTSSERVRSRLLCWARDRSHIMFRNGTSMISLIIPPKDQIPRIAKMLQDEYGTASNIKSRVNRYAL